MSGFKQSDDQRLLLSFPTRRSSDLTGGRPPAAAAVAASGRSARVAAPRAVEATRADRPRSEEHTSELQSQPNLVCRLLLEKTHTNQCCNRPPPSCQRSSEPEMPHAP